MKNFTDILTGDSLRTVWLHYALMAVVCFFAFFVNNQVIPADLMESRNLATAQEMVRTGNYLSPTLNGEPRLEKPPLPTWVAAGIERVLPYDLPAQRCATGVMGTLMVLFLYLLAVRLTQSRLTGLLAAVVMAGCYNVLFMARNATWDIYCHSFMLGAIYFMVAGFSGRGRQWGNFSAAGALMGLSFLGKGPVSFFALLVPLLIAYIAVYRPSAKGKGWPVGAMVVICLAVACWWMAYAYFFHGDAAVDVVAKESSAWLSHNVRPWYYYWQFPAEAGIWAFFLVTALVNYFVCRRQPFRREYTFAVVWFLASLVLLSAVPEKKPRYLLPILIPGAMVIAFYVRQCFEGFRTKGGRAVFRANAAIIAAILLALPVGSYFVFYKKELMPAVLLGLTALVSWALGIYIIRSVAGRIRVLNVVGAVVGAMVMVEALCLIPVGHMFINPDRHSISLLRGERKVEGLPFYYDQGEELRMELVYEANRLIRPIDLQDEAAVLGSAPFVLLSGEDAGELLESYGLTADYVDTFDNNWRKRTDKRYNPQLVRRAVIVR